MWLTLAGIGFAALTGSHYYAYDKGYTNGGNVERIACNERIDKANKAAEELGRQWLEGLTKVVEANSKAAAEDDARNAELQKKLDEYEAQVIAGGGELCLINDDDVNKLR